MQKIKIIGPKYIVTPLAILGLETFTADNEAEARIALDQATQKKEPALILMTERLAVDLETEIDKLNQDPEVNLVLIPDNSGATGLMSRKIDHLIKNSIGAEVIIRQ